jgi:hypothetical protein
MRRRAIMILIVACLLAACDPLGPVATPTPTTPPPTPTEIPAPPTATEEPTETSEPVATATSPAAVATVPPGATATVTSAEAERELLEIENDTSDLRGLKPKQDVPEHFAPPQELSAELSKEIDDEYKPDEARRDAMELWLLRLLSDPTIDLIKLQKDLLGEQVLGFYDPKKDELFVRSGSATLSSEARMTLAHEFTHSLQDQYYDLEKLRPKEIENDRGTAVLSVVEGDASVTGILYAQGSMTESEFQAMLDESGKASTDVLDKAPRYIREGLLFPYDAGSKFVIDLLKPGTRPGAIDYSAVDAALADPPRSTEQIMHPQKYTDKPRDEPLEVAVPPLTDTLGAGWTMTDNDTLGEFDFGVLLKENGVEDSQADEAAAGWGGARYGFYQKGESAVILTVTRWDTDTDATEFNAAMQQSFGSMQKSGTLWSDGKRYFGLKRSGDGVTFAGGTDRAAVESALGSVKP